MYIDVQQQRFIHVGIIFVAFPGQTFLNSMTARPERVFLNGIYEELMAIQSIVYWAQLQLLKTASHGPYMS